MNKGGVYFIPSASVMVNDDVIISSGSIENLVPEEMVTKLKLKGQRNPHPYQVLWM